MDLFAFVNKRHATVNGEHNRSIQVRKGNKILSLGCPPGHHMVRLEDSGDLVTESSKANDDEGRAETPASHWWSVTSVWDEAMGGWSEREKGLRRHQGYSDDRIEPGAQRLQ